VSSSHIIIVPWCLSLDTHRALSETDSLTIGRVPRDETMYTLLSGLYKHLTQKEEYYVIILGLDNAGKTVRLGFGGILKEMK
jgi:hypothetical protein